MSTNKQAGIELDEADDEWLFVIEGKDSIKPVWVNAIVCLLGILCCLVFVWFGVSMLCFGPANWFTGKVPGVLFLLLGALGILSIVHWLLSLRHAHVRLSNDTLDMRYSKHSHKLVSVDSIVKCTLFDDDVYIVWHETKPRRLMLPMILSPAE